ncbi:hypothetical protein Sru01_44660 [Sphaerisporangium rufum]|uniref:Uncharacterized protein n=1 Tax=Sphaerisporangium rufum TaxID=1381558 RepID=A0A919V187_9ACTN|nr:hypothetical protein Sru01_44660 [Sphaerisporangium rufum]
MPTTLSYRVNGFVRFTTEADDRQGIVKHAATVEVDQGSEPKRQLGLALTDDSRPNCQIEQ